MLSFGFNNALALVHTECAFEIVLLHLKAHNFKAVCQCDFWCSLADICAISYTDVYASRT